MSRRFVRSHATTPANPREICTRVVVPLESLP